MTSPPSAASRGASPSSAALPLLPDGGAAREGGRRTGRRGGRVWRARGPLSIFDLRGGWRGSLYRRRYGASEVVQGDRVAMRGAGEGRGRAGEGLEGRSGGGRGGRGERGRRRSCDCDFSGDGSCRRDFRPFAAVGALFLLRGSRRRTQRRHRCCCGSPRGGARPLGARPLVVAAAVRRASTTAAAALRFLPARRRAPAHLLDKCDAPRC